jgi:hypothetical protein
MFEAARWIRLDTQGDAALRAAGAGFALAQSFRAAPAVLWARAEEGCVASALVAPLKFAPGRTRRWPAWALAPLIASYRWFGLRAYLEADAICLSGDRIAASESRTVGACAVVVSRFLPVERGFMEVLRGRIEAQQGWQFDNSWPSDGERAAIRGALAVEATGVD